MTHFLGLPPERLSELLRNMFEEFSTNPIVIRDDESATKTVSGRLSSYLDTIDGNQEKLFVAYSMGRTLVQVEDDIEHLQYAAARFIKFADNKNEEE